MHEYPVVGMALTLNIRDRNNIKVSDRLLAGEFLISHQLNRSVLYVQVSTCHRVPFSWSAPRSTALSRFLKLGYDF